MEKTDYRSFINNKVDEHFPDLWELSSYIHRNPELAFNEFKSAKAQVDFLKKNGFKVIEKAGGLDTAFVAEYISGNGYPTIAFVSEYDALPNGHACGHNLIASSAVGAGFALKELINITGESCTIKIIGTPAEESGGGKIILLNEGVFDGVDSVFMMHPTSDKSRLAGECLSSKRLIVQYIGQSAHAGSHPEKGVNALSASVLFLNACGLLRQQFKGDVRLSSIIKEGGLTTGLIPEESVVYSSFSCFSLSDLATYEDKLVNCAKGIAISLGCECKISVEDGYQGRIPNEVLSNLCKEELAFLGEELLPGLPTDFGGEDLGNVSRRIPICNPYITIFPDYKISNHTEQFKNLAISENGKRCLIVSTKSMAMAAAKLIVNPAIIDMAKEELKERLKRE